MPQPTSSQTLLLFSIGPVQDFIAAARTTRDLWSGSYLLSTLIASALKKIKGEVIFPHINNQPLVEGVNKKEIEKFLTPTLPNRFLAIIPAGTSAKEEAERLTGVIKQQLQQIADRVKSTLKSNLEEEKVKSLKAIKFDTDTFDKQVEKLLEVQWHTLPIPKDIEQLKEWANLLPPASKGYNPTKGLNEGKTWGTLNSLIAWLLDGTKSNRSFDAWREGRWESGKKFNKDSLTGKEEAVFTVATGLSDQKEEELSTALGLNRYSITSGELLGAASVIKRFWDSYYLTTVQGLPSDADQLRKKLPMPNTHAIAQYDNKNEDRSEPKSESEKYFAIIAFDGDQMGKWISGENLPNPITEDDHRKFSEFLNKFSVDHARGIVEKLDGLLIYSGGDDVLAMVPAGNAIHCAEKIRNKFCEIFTEKAPEKFKKINASAGIAIAHYKAPLQDVVKAAMAAEKRAKQKVKKGGLNREAVAITLFKRSGEILEWGTKWDSKGLELLNTLIDKLTQGKLNTRFPHKLEALLTPYLPQSSSIKTDKTFKKEFSNIIELEINHCLDRNEGGKLDGDTISLFSAYWKELNATPADFRQKLTLFINLLRTAAWMTKTRKEDEEPAN